MGVLSPIHPGRTGPQRPGPVPPRREETERMDHMLTEGELRRRRRELHALAGKAEAEPQGKERIRYGLDGPQGRQLYESCSDQELLELLRERAGALGRSPAQNEVHWTCRTYLRARFKNWPNALRAAGLSRSAGRCGKRLEQVQAEEQESQKLLAQVREARKVLGRMPHPSDLPEVIQGLRHQYKTWGEVLAAAGVLDTAPLPPLGPLEEEYKPLLEAVRRRAEELNRAPLRREVEQQVVEALVRRCGSWRRVLEQVDLEPVRRIAPFSNTRLGDRSGKPPARHRGSLHDCYYRLLRVDEVTARDLEVVAQVARRLGRPPERREIPLPVRRRLQEACGSWSNALYQLGLEPRRPG